jgi:osmoprotectant transport system substrate-binding protein
MRLNRTLALGAATLALIGACSSGGGSSPTPATSPELTTSPAASMAASMPAASAAASLPASSAAASAGASAGTAGGAKPAIRIGSAGFYEAKLMGEIYAQVLEASGYTVTRNLGLGTRDVLEPALLTGKVDLVPEYIGSTLQWLNQQAKDTSADHQAAGDAATTAQRLQAALQSKGVTVLQYTPAQDQNGFVVRKDTADQYHLAKVSDLTAVQDKLTWGLPPECTTNPLCGAALHDLYGITIPPKNVKALAACDAPIAQALQNKAVDVAELCTTQPDIARFGFVLLQDDKQSQPSDNIAPLVRDDYLSKTDKASFEKLLNDVSAKMTTEMLTQLGVEINVNQKDIADVAKTWLTQNGFLK